MKKVLNTSAFCLAVMFAGFTACEQNDPVDNNTEEILSVSINSASLYEELGTRELMNELLSNGEYTVVDSMLIYNNDGLLIAKKGIESKTIGGKVMNIDDVPYGDYTLVLWQTVYLDSKHLLAWKVESEDSLSTAHFIELGSPLAHHWAIGYSAANIEFNEDFKGIEMNPRSLGCVMEISIDNFPEDSEYTRAAVVGQRAEDWFRGYYLDPSLPEESRWISDEKYAEVVGRIMPGEDKPHRYFTLLHGEDLSLNIRGDKEDGYESFINCLHMKVEAGHAYTIYFNLDRIMWQPPFFGSKEEFVAWKAERDAGVLVIDPCLDWGTDLPHVQECYRRKNWWADDYFDHLVNNGGTRWYQTVYVARAIREEYGFDTEDGKSLSYIICTCFDSSVSIDMANELVLHQGYVYAGKVRYPGSSADYDIYFSPDNVTEVFVRPYSTWWRIVYQPTDPDDLQYIIPVEPES